MRVGVSVDVETTGLDRESDKIIELAVQRFRFDELGRIIQIGTPRVWREDPGRALDPRFTRLTGLTDELLAGQIIDDVAAAEILTSGDIIVAHNAAFDRPFVDRRLPAVAGRPWACSMAEVDWLDLGFDGRALGYLVTQCGWIVFLGKTRLGCLDAPILGSGISGHYISRPGLGSATVDH